MAGTAPFEVLLRAAKLVGFAPGLRILSHHPRKLP
jgi:hypothetical protein